MNTKFHTFLAVILIVCFCAFPLGELSNVRAGGIPPQAATVPTPISPSGTISDTTPTFTWTRISGATQYQFEVFNGSSLAYGAVTVATGACGSSATNCSNTPTSALSYTAHSWRVRADVGGAWKAYSAFKGFTITNIPTPLAPAGTISDDTPTFTWSRISGATKYQFAVYQGANLQYTKVVATSLCGASTTNCSNTPTTSLSDGAYTWKVQAAVGGAWKPYSTNKSFTIKTIPTPISPSGTIYVTKPTFTWSRINLATQYSFSVYLFDNRGTTLVYSKTVPSSACGSSTVNCSNTPTTSLSTGAYHWKVQAAVGGAWKAYSATKSFTVAVPKPKAGFWMSTTGEEWFYVSPDQDTVEEFSIHEDWGDCLWFDYYYLSMPISNHSFSFDDGLGWSASGTFTSYTTASGQDTLDDYFPPVCYDLWITDSWSFKAKWINNCQDSSQPLSQRTSNSCEYLPHR